jgi:DNA-binding NtrC family response regulator
MDDRELLGDVPLGKLGGAKVLVVDDDEEIRTFLVTLFSDDGIETFCDLRQNRGTEEIAVCIITGYPEYRKLIYDRPVAPPEGFIYKPCDPEHVINTARRILGLRKRKESRTTEKPGTT